MRRPVLWTRYDERLRREIGIKADSQVALIPGCREASG
jgi:hypothetical protein